MRLLSVCFKFNGYSEASDGLDHGIIEVREQRAKPTAIGHGVVVYERHDSVTSLSDGAIPRNVEPFARLENVSHAGAGFDYLLGGIVRRAVVDHDDLLAIVRKLQERVEAAPQIDRTIPRTDRYRCRREVGASQGGILPAEIVVNPLLPKMPARSFYESVSQFSLTEQSS